MIADGDVVMVCVSGGKDSFTLLSMLLALRERAPIDFRIVAMNLDQKQPGFPDHVLPAYFESIGVEYRIVTENTYKIVKDKIPEGKTTCSLCSRLRRGIIYRTAKELGATKIALGHHRDDMIETLFPQHVLRRQDEIHAAQAGQRRRSECGDPSAGLLRREGHRALCPRHGISDHPVQPLWQPGERPAQADQGHACVIGMPVSRAVSCPSPRP
jgi:hypothetical protein